MPLHPLEPYDGVLLASFGGPEGPDDVLPFLRNVTAGTRVPPERLEEVALHYLHRGGVSPINEQNRLLRSALVDELARRDVRVPVVWGNRNWAPYTADALDEAQAAGSRRLLMLVTSAYASYSGCRQYREDLATARGDRALAVDKVRAYFNQPGFVEANVDAVVHAWSSVPADARVVFVTHSIPLTMDEASAVDGPSYLAQHLDVAASVAAQVSSRLGHAVPWDLAFCSRSGPPQQPWLTPDVNDHLRTLATDGVRAVVLAPIGFVSDHMEVVHDLDAEALETAAGLGMVAVRAATAGTHPAFVAGLVDLLLERAAAERARERGEPVPEPVTCGRLGARADRCPASGCWRAAGVDTGRAADCGAP